MSEVPQGEDWWQASDDLWYPPGEQPGDVHEPAHVAAPVGGGGSGSRVPLFAVLGALLIAAMVVAALGVLGNDDDKGSDDEVGLEPIDGGAAGGETDTDGSTTTEGSASETNATTTAPPNQAGVPPSTAPPTPPTSPPASGGGQAVVDASAARWDGGTCVWTGHENTRPFYSSPPTESCSTAAGYAPNGASVVINCVGSGGREIGDDQGNRSATWYNVSYGGSSGYMNSLYFTDWSTLGNPEGFSSC